MKSIHVPFLTVEYDDKNLLVSFAMGEHADTSLTLLRTPVYEVLLEEDERGVSVGTGQSDSEDRQLLMSIAFSKDTVLVKTTGKDYLLSVRSVDEEELAEARLVLNKMNFDQRFTITDA
jgi:hypothetical protein